MVVTFRVSRRRREMYIAYTRLSVLAVCLSITACPHHCTEPDVTWRNGSEVPVVVHYWEDSIRRTVLQTVAQKSVFGIT